MANDIFHGGDISASGATVYPSAARTTTPDTQEYELGPGWRSLTLVINTTAAGTSPSTTFAVNWVDRVSGQTFGNYTSAAITGTGTVTLRISPYLTATGTTVYTDVIQPIARISATHGNATSHTYSVSLILG